MSQTFYDLLELQKNCTQEDVEKSYKKLALRYHPDRNPGDDESASKFLKIQEAYDTLKDPHRRRQYDFSLAGGMGHFARMQMHEQEDLDIRIQTDLTFEEAVLGCKKLIKIRKKKPCDGCAAEGYHSFKTCGACNGRGSTTVNFGGMIRFENMCPACVGRGKVGIDKCNSCQGNRYIYGEEVKIDVTIPGGIRSGMTLAVNGAGHLGRSGHTGNILVTCHVAEDKKYTIKNLDIYFNFDVDFSTMLFGGKIEIPTIEKEVIELQIPERTQNLTNFRVKGKGMPNINNSMARGDLVAVVLTKIPVEKEFLPELKGILKHHGI